MSATLRSPVLVLNKSWAPVNTVTLEDAIVTLFKTEKNGEPKARIVEYPSYQTFTWQDWANLKTSVDDKVIRSQNLVFRVPEIIVLSRYNKLPTPKCHFSRRNLYKRDNYACQYCSKKLPSSELTIDHVMPTSRGGHSTWENCVLACVSCNSKKANRTPEEAHMKLLRKPKRPRVPLFRVDHLKKIESWEAFLGEMYWSVSIED